MRASEMPPFLSRFQIVSPRPRTCSTFSQNHRLIAALERLPEMVLDAVLGRGREVREPLLRVGGDVLDQHGERGERLDEAVGPLQRPGHDGSVRLDHQQQALLQQAEGGVERRAEPVERLLDGVLQALGERVDGRLGLRDPLLDRAAEAVADAGEAGQELVADRDQRVPRQADRGDDRVAVEVDRRGREPLRLLDRLPDGRARDLEDLGDARLDLVEEGGGLIGEPAERAARTSPGRACARRRPSPRRRGAPARRRARRSRCASLPSRRRRS